MGMPLDLYVIRHGESEANVIINAGEQGDNSLYTQDNVTVPDRSWRLTATGRKQADCIGRWLVAQQQLFDRYLVSPYVRTRETAATMALPKAKWEETRVLRERSWGEINTITQDDFRTNYARNWMFKRTDPLYWRPPAGESIADVSENRVHNLLTSLNRRAEAESVVAVTHGDFMLALMLTLEDLRTGFMAADSVLLRQVVRDALEQGFHRDIPKPDEDEEVNLVLLEREEAEKKARAAALRESISWLRRLFGFTSAPKKP